ncbi:MAG: hypothetical protein HWN68_11785 [Desulfobacterales bacterium]|nr:hypothetical protein [Desulfobacterales bacterium]
MEIKETVQKLLQEMVVPDLSRIRDENSKILAILDVTNKRLGDMNTHLADQSRRIDDVRSELGQRIDDVRSELGQRIDETNKRIDETNKRIDAVHSDLINRLDANNARIDRFFLESVSKDEHQKFDERVARLEREVEAIRRQMAA